MTKPVFVLFAAALTTVSITSACADYTDPASIAILEARIADLENRLADAEVRLNQAKVPVAAISNCIDSSVNLRMASVGFMCKTSTGSIFTRVVQDKLGESWKGTDGTIWGSDISGSFKQDAAGDQCTDISATLPTQSNFERGEANGIREVLAGLSGLNFWSSTQGPGGMDYAGAYYIGDSGAIDFAIPNSSLAVRCVTR